MNLPVELRGLVYREFIPQNLRIGFGDQQRGIFFQTLRLNRQTRAEAFAVLKAAKITLPLHCSLVQSFLNVLAEDISQSAVRLGIHHFSGALSTDTNLDMTGPAHLICEHLKDPSTHALSAAPDAGDSQTYLARQQVQEMLGCGVFWEVTFQWHSLNLAVWASKCRVRTLGRRLEEQMEAMRALRETRAQLKDRLKANTLEEEALPLDLIELSRRCIT